QSLRDARLPSGVLVVVVARDDEIILPSGDTVISAGDRVTILGQQRDLLLFARNQLLNPRRTRPEQRATIVGGGEAGRLVALGLLNRGWAVDILEKSSDTIEKLDLPEDIVVRRADGTEMQSFEINDVASSSLLVAVTSSDETNLLVSLLAQYVGIDRIITRADRLSNERMFERLGVDVVRSARGAAIRRVVREITGHDEVKAELEHGALQMIEVKVHSQFGMIGLADLQRETGLKMVVGAISRRDPVTRIKNWVIPNGKTKIESGDTMYIICDHLTSESALGYFGSARIGE
ncbi:MAG: TrkA C-terminal domain-containing protein, partial [Myxococcota bacterium]|nr:TrkA C-terminal domain-containing protein [Myxococcota bacterium]